MTGCGRTVALVNRPVVLQRYIGTLPTAEIVMTWYNRATGHGVLHRQGVPHLMGQAPLLDGGSRNPPRQVLVFGHPPRAGGTTSRSTDFGAGTPPVDLASLDRWEDYTEAEQTYDRPRAVDPRQDPTKRGRIDAMRSS